MFLNGHFSDYFDFVCSHYISLAHVPFYQFASFGPICLAILVPEFKGDLAIRVFQEDAWVRTHIDSSLQCRINLFTNSISLV